MLPLNSLKTVVSCDFFFLLLDISTFCLNSRYAAYRPRLAGRLYMKHGAPLLNFSASTSSCTWTALTAHQGVTSTNRLCIFVFQSIQRMWVWWCAASHLAELKTCHHLGIGPHSGNSICLYPVETYSFSIWFSMSLDWLFNSLPLKS